MRRLFLLLLIVAVFGYAWIRFREIPLLVIGQPASTGLLQGSKETVFFAELRQRTGLPLNVTYKELESVGIKDTHQLVALKQGSVDLVSLRFLQNGAQEPALQGIDLPGIIFDFASAKRVSQAYFSTLDRYLQERHETKLLGIWTFGPQEIFCRKQIKALDQLRGLKVRVGGDSLLPLLGEFGAVGVVLPFDGTAKALQAGLVDCAVTSAASANFAGWLDHVPHAYALATHFGLNGYAISLKKWKGLMESEQVALQQAFSAFEAELWDYTELIHEDAHRCITGQGCRFGKSYQGTLVQPSNQDVVKAGVLGRGKSLTDWGRKCDLVHPGCMQEWQEKIGGMWSGVKPY